MTLAPGSHVGDYEIVASLGAGGMGEVYRARDTRLNREVAVKVLSDAVARSGDAHNIARFEREARSVAALSHPNILGVYQYGTHNGAPYLVTELLEGTTLRQRIERGDLTWKKAVAIAADISEGLAAAHAKGIVHRDLKPENVFITNDGVVKILDFGLARQDAAAPVSQSGATPLITEPGTVMGTLEYMSPEQLRGEHVDSTTDLFSLGCILYEMIGGRSPFVRPSRSETVSAILRDDPPDLQEIRKNVPPELAELIARCLAKEPTQRFQSARDLVFDLRRTIEHPPRRTTSKARWALLALLIAVAAFAWITSDRWSGLVSRARSTERTLTSGDNATRMLTQLTARKEVEQFPSWSPDGSRIVFSRETGALRSLFIRTLATSAETQLTRGDADDIQPSWSPDGKTILFMRAIDPGGRLGPADLFAEYDYADIWSIDVASGKETRLIRNASNPAWSPDGSKIAFAAAWSGSHRIWIAGSQGQNTQQVTSDTSEAAEHTNPNWSPDGSRIVFQNIYRTQFDIRVVDLATKEQRWLTNDLILDVNPVWSPSGRFVYFSSYRGGGINVWRVRLENGKAIAIPEQVTTGAGQDVDLAISRDGKRLALATLNQNADLWRLPVTSEGLPRGDAQELVATTREDSRGSWSPDGKSIAFSSDRGGDMNIWVRSLADGVDQQLTRGPGGDFQPDWSPDGSRLTFFSGRAGSIDIWDVNVRNGALRRLTRASSSETHPFFSPDGRKIAYMSDADGRLELWTMNADGTDQRQVTRGGVAIHFIRWSPDGSKIYYRSAETRRLMIVPATGGDPQLLPPIQGGGHISFSPDRSRIMDVINHQTLWVSPLTGGEPKKVFEFPDRDIRIDYPVWSPDGQWVLFDRLRPEGGDIWMLESFE